MRRPDPPAAGSGPSARATWLPVAAIAAATVGLIWLLLALTILPGGEAWGFDLQAYQAAASRLADGAGLYTAETLEGPFQPVSEGLYLYPPPFAVAVMPLVGLSLGTATAIWYLLHVLCLAAACAVMPVRADLRLLGFAVGAFSYAAVRDLALGNVSIMLLLPLAVAWRWLDRPLGSVAMALVITIRPTMAVYLAWWAMRRCWRALGWCLLTGMAILIATLPLVGVGAYADYLTLLRNVSDVTGAPNNLDLGSTLLDLGGSLELATWAYLGGIAVAVAAILLGLRRDHEVGFMVTLGASLLLSPLLWDHYLAVLVLPAVFLAQRGRSWGLLLPLLTWLPAVLLPLVAIAATLLPFLARDRQLPAEPTRASGQVMTSGQVPT